MSSMAYTCILLPAYGRNHCNAKQAMEIWNAGLDFKIAGGPYCSNRDLQKFIDEGFRELLFTDNTGREVLSMPL